MKANITWLTGTLATGGDLALLPEDAIRQRQDIIDQGVRMVIDLRQEMSDQEVWEGTPVVYVRTPTTDAEGWHVPPEVFDAVLEAARAAESEGAKVLVHCHMGVNRGPSAAYAVLLDRGMDVIEAYDLIREKRPVVGLAYAEDALKARLIRDGVPPKAGRALVKKLRDHVQKTWTEEQINKIVHVIREHHEWDTRQWTELERRYAKADE